MLSAKLSSAICSWVWPQVPMAQALLGTTEVDITGRVLFCR